MRFHLNHPTNQPDTLEEKSEENEEIGTTENEVESAIVLECEEEEEDSSQEKTNLQSGEAILTLACGINFPIHNPPTLKQEMSDPL